MLMDEYQKWTWAKPTNCDVALENNCIVYSGLWHPYHPFDFPNLPNALAKVDNIKSAIEFSKKYGILGYRSFTDTTTEVYCKGDPVEWFLAQALTIRFILFLIKAIQNNDDEEIKSLISDTVVQVPLNTFYENAPTGHYAPAHISIEGQETVYRIFNSNYWKDKYHLFALQMVNLQINKNTEGVRRQLILNEREMNKSVPQFASRSLIEAIWYMVGDIYLLSFEDKGKGIRTCEECGMPFIVTDKRQKFCPGDQFSKGSLCGARQRVRRARKPDGLR